MEAFSIFGLLLNALSLGRFAQWTVQASARDFIYVNDDVEEFVPTLRVEVCNVGRYGITLHPLEYRIKQKGQTLVPYNVRAWRESNSSEDTHDPRLESGELRICETRLPVVQPKETPMLTEVIVKTHCGKSVRKIVKNHPIVLNDMEIVIADGRDIKEYFRNEFPNYPV